MSDEAIQRLFSERMGGERFGLEEKVYKFEKIKRAKREAKQRHPDMELLDFGVGEPDEVAPQMVIEALKVECGKPENRGYADNGIEELKVAAAEYMERVYGVAGIDPHAEVIHSIGSKCALAMMPAAFINSGDVTLMTTPGYPVMATHTEWYGGSVVRLPLLEENRFLPDFAGLDEETLRRAKLLYLNYPNNPTGAGATGEFFEEVVRLAKEYNMVVVHDAAYSALSYDEKPLSFLSIEGAKDVGVEIHSFSKAYNMTGWRLAFLVGSPRVIKAFAYVKDNFDSGQFIAIQRAGIYALKHPELTEKIKARYRRRLRLMVDALKEAGFSARMPDGTFYLYVKAPVGAAHREFGSAEDASQYLIREALISTVPWDDAGSFLRFSATFMAKDEGDEERVIEEMKRRLKGLGLRF